MGCGMGGCYSCVVLTREAGHAPHFVRSCIDGPVFDSTRIVWEALGH
jgi:dihydroorotate dehydrogenase electron transfer subunit